MNAFRTISLLVPLSMLLSGCLHGPAEPHDTDSDVQTTTFRYVTLVDMEWNFTNRQPNPFVNPVEITTFNVAANMTNLTIRVEQIARPAHYFSDTIHLNLPDGKTDVEAFGPPAYLIRWNFTAPQAGEWTLEYSTDEIYPLGMHRLRVTIGVVLKTTTQSAM